MIRIPLTKGQYALIDDEDYNLVKCYTWYAERSNSIREFYYASTHIKLNGKQTTLKMHRIITHAQTGELIDHKDGNGLNNQKDNLRSTTQTNNIRNSFKKSNTSSSKYKGVSWCKRKSLWKAYLTIDYKYIHLGYFNNEIDAARAYNKAATQNFGPFVRINVILD